MNRRDFNTLLSGAAAWPLAAGAQQPAMPVVGFLQAASAWEYAPQTASFHGGLSETGYVEYRNMLIDYRWAEGHYERLSTMAGDLVRRQVTVIFAGSIPTLAAKAATTRIPIVFSVGGDPVQLGLVASLNRPGGNLTGLTNLNQELGPKRLQLLRELVPTGTTIARLVNPTAPNTESVSQEFQATALTLGLNLHVLGASTEHGIDAAFATLAQVRPSGLVIGSDSFFNSRAEQLATLALHHGVPTIYQFRQFAEGGGLISYGPSFSEG
jgi:putative ABC transport system substrate-binding protein